MGKIYRLYFTFALLLISFSCMQAAKCNPSMSSSKMFPATSLYLCESTGQAEPSFAWESKQQNVTALPLVPVISYRNVNEKMGMNAPEKIARIIARPMKALSWLAAPFVWLLAASTKAMIRLFGFKKPDDSKVTEEEIKAIIREGTEIGEIQEVEEDIVSKVFNLGDRKIGSIMTHRSDLVWLEIDEPVESIRDKVKANVFTVYPVAQKELDNIVGVVHLKDLFGKIDSPDFNLKDFICPAKFFPENQSVYNTLEYLKTQHTKYGLVTDEFGSIQGIVTLKDIVNVLLGSVTEIEEEPAIIKREDGSLLVDGQCSFYDFLEYIHLDSLYPEYDYNTISGLILEILEHIPRTGEKLHWQGFELEIVDMDGARIDKILVKKNTKV